MVVRYGMKGVLVEMLALLLMVMIEIIIEGEAGGLALVVFGGVLMVVGGVRVHLKRRR